MCTSCCRSRLRYPLYEQIKDQIRTAVLSGVLAAGETLPSLRELARDVQVSLITVTRAYNDLAVEGVIGTRQGKGTVVLPVDPTRLRPHIAARIRRGVQEAVDAAMGGVGIAELHGELQRAWQTAANTGMQTGVGE